MSAQDHRKFGESFSWPLWDAATGIDQGEGGDEFILENASGPLGDLVVGQVRRPRCFGFVPERSNGRAALVLAGGGYTKLVVGKEGFEVAHWLATLGLHAFVLVHRFPSAAFAGGSQCGAQAPVDDAIEAMRQIRARAPELGIDPRGVGVFGLSSGGRLLAFLL